MTGLALTTCVAAQAAPTATSAEDDAGTANRSARASAPSNADAPVGESRTMQMLLELQSSRAPLEGGDRARPNQPPTPAPAVPKPAATAPEPTPAQNPFSRALEMGKPATTRELRGPTVTTPAAGDAGGKQTPEPAAWRGDRYGESSGPEAEQALREKIGWRIPMPVALMRYIRENRAVVLMFSLASLALVGWMGARAAQKRR